MKVRFSIHIFHNGKPDEYDSRPSVNMHQHCIHFCKDDAGCIPGCNEFLANGYWRRGYFGRIVYFSNKTLMIRGMKNGTPTIYFVIEISL